MREIKFRAWDVEACHMVGWEELQDEWETEGYSGTVFRGDHWVPMQFTGLRDKNDQEVYEGDICRFHPDPEEDLFFHGLAYVNDDRVGGSWKIIRCDNEPLGEPGLDSTSFWNEDFEIIGNIYENPELLEAK